MTSSEDVMNIKTFKLGSDGRVRPVEDRPLKSGGKYMARMSISDEFTECLCVDVPVIGLAFVDPGFPNFKVATSYYAECFEIQNCEQLK